jgi:DNA-directed RNA polymerase subunit beta'
MMDDMYGEGGYSDEFDTFEYPDGAYNEGQYYQEGQQKYGDNADNGYYQEGNAVGEEETFDQGNYYEVEDGKAEIVYDEEKYAKDGDNLGREDSISGVDDAHISHGEETHNDGDFTETEFNLQGIDEDDYSDGL